LLHDKGQGILKKLNFLTLALLVIFSSSATANRYYPQHYQNDFANGDTTEQALKDTLFKILTSQHQTNGRNADSLGCSSNRNGHCYQQISLGYKGARKVLFGKLHLEEDSRGYFVKDVYCRKEFTKSQTNVGPNIIPNNNILNCEHTWPQSRFSRKFSKGSQKSDLHHLFPTDSKANGIRGNSPFTDVRGGQPVKGCSASRTEGKNGGRYEPPAEHKGNVARALFYFSVRYQIQIDSKQEATLKSWHIQDPVDAAEMERNNQIFHVQHNRNPFIDYPELVDRISNF